VEHWTWTNVKQPALLTPLVFPLCTPLLTGKSQTKVAPPLLTGKVSKPQSPAERLAVTMPTLFGWMVVMGIVNVARVMIRPLNPTLHQLFFRAELVLTKTGGLMTMDQNHWNSAELLALLPAIRTMMLLVRIVTVDVVQMMPPSATVIKTTSTTSTAQV
jgi:hypothetical protein